MSETRAERAIQWAIDWLARLKWALASRRLRRERSAEIWVDAPDITVLSPPNARAERTADGRAWRIVFDAGEPDCAPFDRCLRASWK